MLACSQKNRLNHVAKNHFMKLGIFGGSFDPIHQGHLILAECALEAAQLDQILFVPADISPLKPDGPRATDRQRMEMLQLATGGNPKFSISRMELDREGVSYTVDTLEAIHQQQPEDELFLLMGADSLESLDQWKDVPRICDLAIPLVAMRPGHDADLNQLSPFVSGERLDVIKGHAFESPLIQISSSQLRKNIMAGTSVRYRTPRSVECYLQNAKLYQENKT